MVFSWFAPSQEVDIVENTMVVKQEFRTRRSFSAYFVQNAWKGWRYSRRCGCSDMFAINDIQTSPNICHLAKLTKRSWIALRGNTVCGCCAAKKSAWIYSAPAIQKTEWKEKSKKWPPMATPLETPPGLGSDRVSVIELPGDQVNFVTVPPTTATPEKSNPRRMCGEK